MSPFRVLTVARELLAKGYLPLSSKGESTDAVGNAVAYCHPGAKNFTFVGAIQRAIWNITKETYHERIGLYNMSCDPIIKGLGGPTKASDFFKTCTRDECLAIIDGDLKRRNKYDD